MRGSLASRQSELTRSVAAVGPRTALQDGGAVVLCGRAIAADAAGWMGAGPVGELPDQIPPRSVEEMPEGYESGWRTSRRGCDPPSSGSHAANAETMRLYWSIGRDILDRRDRQGWGAKVLVRLSADLQREFPGRLGFSVSNLNYMRAMVAAWPGAVGPCPGPPRRSR